MLSSVSYCRLYITFSVTASLTKTLVRSDPTPLVLLQLEYYKPFFGLQLTSSTLAGGSQISYWRVEWWLLYLKPNRCSDVLGMAETRL